LTCFKDINLSFLSGSRKVELSTSYQSEGVLSNSKYQHSSSIV